MGKPYSEKLDFDKVWLMFQETDKKFKETDRKFLELQQEVADARKEYLKDVKKLDSKFQSQWSRFVEALVAGDLINLLKQKGINVSRTSLREKSFFNNRQYEIDIVARNGEEIVAVEVKTTLSPDYVKEFVDELKDYKQAYKEFNGKILYGAMAYISVEGKAEIYAEKQGLFVIKATGDSASIINAKNFKPKSW